MIALGKKYIAYFRATLNCEVDMNIIGNRGRNLKKSAYINQILLAFTSSNAHLGWDSVKAFNECLGVNNVFPSVT